MSFNETIEIVLVEDNPDDVDITLHAFKKNSLRNKIHTLEDGVEALDFFFCRGAYAERQGKLFNYVVLLDLKLPRLNGFEVLKQLKSNPATRAIPVVVLTSSKEDRDLTESYNLGVNSYLVKPLDFAKFSEAIREFSKYWLVLNEPVAVVTC